MVITRNKIALVLIVIAAGALALLADRLIVTDRERVERTVEAITTAAGAPDVAAIFSHISEDYTDPTFLRDDLRMLAEMFFKKYGGVRVRILGHQVRVSGDTATDEVEVFAAAARDEYAQGRSRWMLEFRKEGPKVWRVTRVTPLELQNNPLEGWGALRSETGL